MLLKGWHPDNMTALSSANKKHTSSGAGLYGSKVSQYQNSSAKNLSVSGSAGDLKFSAQQSTTEKKVDMAKTEEKQKSVAEVPNLSPPGFNKPKVSSKLPNADLPLNLKATA